MLTVVCGFIFVEKLHHLCPYLFDHSISRYVVIVVLFLLQL
jgi:hypothetical protein